VVPPKPNDGESPNHTNLVNPSNQNIVVTELVTFNRWMTVLDIPDTIEQMMDSQDYELLDFGQGMKLERFGDVVVERPCPAAESAPAYAGSPPDSIFTRQTSSQRNGKWTHRKQPPPDWQIRFEDICLELSCKPTGQVGVFPEQRPNWQWIKKQVARRPGAKVLNLFAYTGASTIAAAAAGAAVTHIDGAKSVVGWARRNAAHSGLESAPIRWIVEDAVKFVEREVKRGNRYDGIILDPPSYGHGPKGEEWKLSRDLFDLLGDCKQLLSSDPLLFLLSCHTPGFGAPELSAALSTCLFGSCGAGVKTRSLSLQTTSGRRLPAGHAAYWP